MQLLYTGEVKEMFTIFVRFVLKDRHKFAYDYSVIYTF